MGENKDISKLLRLKRYEQPPPEYFDDFLLEFRRRQRAELMKRSSWELLWERVTSIAPTFRVPQFAYAAIVGLAVVASVAIVAPRPSGTAPALAAANTTQAIPALSLSSSRPVTISDTTLPVAARTDGSLPPHYVLQARPVSNEQPLSF